jgi:hypothetical protein
VKIRTISVIFLMFAAISLVWAATEEDKNLKNIQFESLLIQGQVQRPDVAIVTGDPGNDLDGLLRLRSDFNDLMAADAGEEIK